MNSHGLEYGFRACTGRRLKPAERVTLERLHDQAVNRYEGDVPAAIALLRSAEAPVGNYRLAAWVVVANVVLNLDETITRG
jgi:hypothetical protein